MIRDVHHISLSTKNFERLLHFYSELLGLPFATSYDWDSDNPAADKVVGLEHSAVKTALLRAGNTFVEIFEYTNPIGNDPIDKPRACDAGITHICFDVVDVDGEYQRLLAAGVEFHTPPVDVGGVVRTTYGRDPDGNIFELQEVTQSGLALGLENVVPDIDSQVIK